MYVSKLSIVSVVYPENYARNINVNFDWTISCLILTNSSLPPQQRKIIFFYSNKHSTSIIGQLRLLRQIWWQPWLIRTTLFRHGNARRSWFPTTNGTTWSYAIASTPRRKVNWFILLYSIRWIDLKKQNNFFLKHWTIWWKFFDAKWNE